MEVVARREQISGEALNSTQRELLDRLVDLLDGDQLIWVQGYLAGVAQARTGGTAKPPAQPAEPVLIVYASQTGNATAIARRLEHALTEQGVPAEAKDAKLCKISKLKSVKTLVVVASTHGEGEPPDSAQLFYRDLLGERAPRLKELEFAVLALGDTSYEHFCETGRVVDERLEALGGKRIAPRVDCDLDYEASVEAWTAELVSTLRERHKALSVVHSADAPRAGTPRLDVVPKSGKQIAVAELAVNQRITGRDSTKDVRHVELEFTGSPIAYQPGDSLAIMPRNAEPLVNDLLAALNLDGAAEVKLGEGRLALADALTRELEITTLTKPLLTRYNALAGSAALTALLEDLPRLREYMEGRDLLDLVREHPVVLEPQALTDLLRRMPARSYSIASGPGTGDEVHLTVGVVQYEAFGRARKGVASNFLAELPVGEPVSCYLEPNDNFRLPQDPSKPIIMIGAGTGAAPYRSFLEARDESGASGPAWLIFGDRNFHSDFLYQAEWIDYRARGVLTRIDVAFSRDTAEKVYVQNRILEHGAEIYRWLQDGAYLYVCGDAKAMAPDVHEALITVAAAELDGDREAATDYVLGLMQEGRYQRDVY